MKKFVLIILTLLISLFGRIQCQTKPKNFDAGMPCCVGDNIFPSSCPNQTEGILLQCEHGKYMIDPSMIPEDEFEITKEGDLNIQEGEQIVERGEFCVTKYMPQKNDTRFVAFVCFTNDEPASYVFFFRGILTLVSVFFIVLTLYIYRKIRSKDTQDRVTCYCLTCLTFFFLCLGLIQIFMPDQLLFHALCVPLAFTLYFFVIAYFSWLNVVMANVWKSVVVRRWAIRESTWYLGNHIYAWSIPIVLETIIIISHNTDSAFIDPKIGVNSCWFGGSKEMWVFMYLPMTIMLTINVILFVWTCVALHITGADLHPDRKRALQYKCVLYLKLFLLVGLTWIFDVFSYSFGYHWFWFIIDVLNSLHGFLVFLILVVWRSRIRKELAGKTICCCIQMPERWSHNVDAEHERLNENEEEGINTHQRLNSNTIDRQNEFMFK